MNTLKNQKKSQIYALGTVLLWASAFVSTKIALIYFKPESVGVLRYVVASIFFLVIGFYKRIGLPKRKDIPKFLFSGALGFTFYMITFNKASQSLTSATGSVIIASAPVFTALFASVVFKEKIKTMGWIAIAVEFGGILILALWDGIFSVNGGVFWMFIASICISIYNLFQRYYVKKYSAIQSTAYNIFAGTLFLLIYLPSAAKQLKHVVNYQLFVIIFMGIFPSALAYMFWAKALSIAIKTSDVTNFMFVTPFIAALMGFLIIGETPTLATFAGGAMIIFGLLMFQKINMLQQIKG
ncbi:MAG: DMT family transporter [Bacillota bacterium]|nr:DMT family transporter [Bacillota bacterium]